MTYIQQMVIVKAYTFVHKEKRREKKKQTLGTKSNTILRTRATSTVVL